MGNQDQFEPLGGYQNGGEFSPQDMAPTGGSNSSGQQFQQENQGMQGQQVQEGHKMSHAKVGLIIFGVLAVLILGLTLFSRVRVNKVESQSPVQKEEAVKVEETTAEEDAANSLVSQAESLKNKGKSEDSDSAGEESNDSAKSEINEENVGTLEVEEKEEVAPAEQGTMSEMGEDPSLSEERSTSVIVSSKNIYKVDNSSYAYSLSLLMLADGQEDESATVKYFCSRNSFDAVSKGDNLTMKYQVDSNGVVSVSGLTR